MNPDAGAITITTYAPSLTLTRPTSLTVRKIIFHYETALLPKIINDDAG